jgi:hypothetical protein
MAGFATWEGRPISLEEFMSGGGFLAARCTRCEAITPLTNPDFHRIARASSVARLEDGVRCSCGGRGGSLAMLRDAPEPASRHRCYLFHG